MFINADSWEIGWAIARPSRTTNKINERKTRLLYSHYFFVPDTSFKIPTNMLRNALSGL